MKTKSLMTIGALLGTCLLASAQDDQRRPNRPHRPMGPPPPALLKEFDKDGDGKLSDEERKAMHEAMKARMEERRKEMLEKYDTDGDGKLSEEERRKARAAELIKRFDKDGDGKLDEAELAAMPMPKPRPGPGGWQGRRGHGGPDDSGPEDDLLIPEE